MRIKRRGGGDEKMIIRKTIYSHELVESELLDVLPVGRGEKTSPLAHLPTILNFNFDEKLNTSCMQ